MKISEELLNLYADAYVRIKTEFELERGVAFEYNLEQYIEKQLAITDSKVRRFLQCRENQKSAKKQGRLVRWLTAGEHGKWIL